jgi:hypothetical protein
VYKALFENDHPFHPNLSYELRDGKGGNIYSFKSVSGECIPKQWAPTDVVYDNSYAT